MQFIVQFDGTTSAITPTHISVETTGRFVFGTPHHFDTPPADVTPEGAEQLYDSIFHYWWNGTRWYRIKNDGSTW